MGSKKKIVCGTFYFPQKRNAGSKEKIVSPSTPPPQKKKCGVQKDCSWELINEMFHFGINNVVGKPIIDKDFLKIFLSSLRKILWEEDSSLALEISVL